MAIYKGDQRILGIGATGDYAGATTYMKGTYIKAYKLN